MRVRMLIGFLGLCAGGVAQTALPPAPLPVTGEPYTAERTTTSYQKLADGTSIEHKSTVSLARDSQGRMWTKAKLPGDPLRPETMERYSISVYDPNTRTSTSWCTCNKFMTVKHFGDPLARRTERDPGIEGMDVYLGPSSSIRLKYHVEELPPQTIMGVTTRGSKAVRTIPAGVDGNDRDLTVTIQSWYSPELRLALMTIIDDPVKGLTKMEFENLKRVEPNPAIFRVPAGLMLQEAPAALR
jgi:hypothetical protein